MKLRSLILATIVLLALVGTLYWSEHHKPGEETAKAADASPTILKLDQASITKFEVKNKDTEPIVLSKNGSGVWQITQPKKYAADQSNVSSALSSLSSLEGERVIDDKPADLKQYGLVPPSAEVDVTEKDNKSQRLLLGDATPAGSAVYAMLEGDPRVYTMASYHKSSIDKSLNDFRDKRLLQVNADQVSRVELDKKNQTIEFGRIKDGWQILRPKPLRANSIDIGELVSKLTDAKMDLGASNTDKESASSFASGAPVATAKLTDPSGTQELQIRKNKDTYYAKSSMVGGIYKVNADLGQAVDKSLDDFRNKKVFDFAFNDPNRIEVHAGSKAYFLVRSGNDWWNDGKKMDADSVQQLVSNLRFIAADKYVDSGFSNPVIETTVTYDDGKSTEKVSIGKVTDGYIAKRENDPGLYHLQASSVDALQKAVDEIKPAANTTTQK